MPAMFQKLLPHRRASRPVESVQGSPLWHSLLFSEKTALIRPVHALPGACPLVDVDVAFTSLRVPSGIASLDLGAGVRPAAETAGRVPRWLYPVPLPRQNLRGLIDPHARQYLVLLVFEILSISMCL